MGFAKEVSGMLRDVIGLEVRRLKSISTPAAKLVASLLKFNIDLVLDVGANQGQFASEIRRSGYTGNIVSFEPLSKAHSKLLKAS